jgi:3-hydroxymyristoyl/3-hydroxydecanoyl-(acyl carrier protein) dehydratase
VEELFLNHFTFDLKKPGVLAVEKIAQLLPIGCRTQRNLCPYAFCALNKHAHQAKPKKPISRSLRLVEVNEIILEASFDFKSLPFADW